MIKGLKGRIFVHENIALEKVRERFRELIVHVRPRRNRDYINEDPCQR